MNSEELLPDSMEIFLYYCEALRFITRLHGNIPILLRDPENYYQRVWKYSYIIMGPWELSPGLLKIFLDYHRSLGNIPQTSESYNHKDMGLL
jgi:hypothetical protein